MVQLADEMVVHAYKYDLPSSRSGRLAGATRDAEGDEHAGGLCDRRGWLVRLRSAGCGWRVRADPRRGAHLAGMGQSAQRGIFQ